MPTGYSFNLGGAAIYLSLAALYLAQATDTPLSIPQELGLLSVMLLTSKGAAGGEFIALTATPSTLGTVPAAATMLIFGIDKFMSECRALVNLYGNAVATLVISKWARTLDVDRAASDDAVAHTDGSVRTPADAVRAENDREPVSAAAR